MFEGDRIRRWVIVAVTLLAGGCAGGGPAPVDHHFRLVVPSPSVLPAPLLDGVLVVRRFSADGLLGQRPLVYARADSPQALFQYNYHFWSDPPTVMLQEFAVRYLRRAAVATQVATPALGVEADFMLTGRIERFEHLRDDAAAVAVEVELAVFDNRRRELVSLDSYREALPVAAAEVQPAVVVINEALARIMARFVSDLAAR